MKRLRRRPCDELLRRRHQLLTRQRLTRSPSSKGPRGRTYARLSEEKKLDAHPNGKHRQPASSARDTPKTYPLHPTRSIRLLMDRLRRAQRDGGAPAPVFAPNRSLRQPPTTPRDAKIPRPRRRCASAPTSRTGPEPHGWSFREGQWTPIISVRMLLQNIHESRDWSWLTMSIPSH
jgi:hypothetical protein